MNWSYSRINYFEKCPLQFNYRYVERIKKEKEEGVEAFLGSRVHETLEKLYTDKKMLKDDSLEELIDYYTLEWEKNWHENVKIIRKEYKEDNYFRLGEKYITDYYKRYYPFNESKTIALEHKMFFNLGEYKITGVIDRLSQRNDGTYEIRDYKTNSSLPEQAHFDKDRQLALYQIGLKQKWEDAEKTELIWHYLAFDKEMKSTRNEEQLKELQKSTVTLIKEIEKAVENNNFTARESALCNWCDYQDICPKRKHLYETGQMSLNKFMKEPGVKLVNAFRDLKEQESFVKKELNELKEAVLKYSQENSIDVIIGSDRKLTVKIEDSEDIPTKTNNPEEHKKLEEMLMKSTHWNDVSSINASLLRKALDNNVFKTDFQNKIAKMLVKKHTEEIRLKKLKEE